MASTGSEKKLGLLHLAICSLSFWGLGVSIGRFFPAHTPDSLAKRLTHACSTYEVSSSLLYIACCLLTDIRLTYFC